ncbi:MAG: hypothetical protein JW967_05940 [Dehalococcoidales bacterium]|nr:hypothetical protein [Dehalococcoidales bacterium]
MKPPSRQIRNFIPYISFGIIIALAAFIRIWAAPLSAGPDVNQFWAFAKIFQEHGLDFYRYAGANGDIFPVQGWSFNYPPVWLLILGISLAFAPQSVVNSSFIDISWRFAMKGPLIFADLAIGGVIFWAVPGSKYKKLLFASLWLLNPAAWYESAVFGQFDTIAALFLLLALVMLVKKHDRIAFLFAGLALLTKQHTVFSIILMIIASARIMNYRYLLRNFLIIAGVSIIFSAPFWVTGNFGDYCRSIFYSSADPAYQYPLMFCFNGLASLLSYLHNIFGWETIGLIRWSVGLAIAAFITTGVFIYLKRITPLQAILIGILLFVALFYRINYQYLIIIIPLAIYAAAQTSYKSERAITLALAIFPAIWVWLFNDYAWFINFSPKAIHTEVILSRLWLSNADLPDYVYVTFSVILMCLCLTYVIMVFVRWHRKPQDVIEKITVEF